MKVIVVRAAGEVVIFRPKSAAARATLRELGKLPGVNLREDEVTDLSASEARHILTTMKETSVWVNSQSQK